MNERTGRCSFNGYNVRRVVSRTGQRLVDAAATAAVEAGVGRIVLHSVLHPHAPRMPHHMRKAAGEDAVRRAGIPWTILQPAIYAQTVIGMLRPGVEEIPLLWSPSAPMTPVHLGDVAEVAATVLTEDGHAAASYELAGPETLGLGEMIAQAAAITGRELRTRPADPAQVAHRIADTPQHAAELTAMFTEYGDNGLLGNGRVLGWLLGREPTSAIKRHGAIMLFRGHRKPRNGAIVLFQQAARIGQPEIACGGPSGSSARMVVPAPVAECSHTRPPSASTRSLSPTKPDPPAGSAPPRPLSRTQTRSTPSPSVVSTWTWTVEASACLAVLVSASATR
jgi:NmrA-like family